MPERLLIPVHRTSVYISLMKYLVANWKTNFNSAQVQEWCEQFLARSNNPELEIVICPSLIHVQLVAELLAGVALGTQTLSSYPNGAYTGAVSALQASEWARYAILGHSERRRYFHETDQVVAQQVIQALDNNLTPIVAVDDKNWSSQLSQFEPAQIAKLLVMYEPPEAISSSGGGGAADIERVKKAAQLIKSEYKVRGCLYGGSVDEKNVAQYFGAAELDGAVVGNASLDAARFNDIMAQCR